MASRNCGTTAGQPIRKPLQPPMDGPLPWPWTRTDACIDLPNPPMQAGEGHVPVGS